MSILSCSLDLTRFGCCCRIGRTCVKYLRQLRWDIRHETQPPTLVHIYLVIQTDTRFSPLIFLWLLNPAIF